MAPRILVIEDHAETARLIVQALAAEPHAFEATSVTSCRAGLAHLADHPVDCVLLDYRLPDGDGCKCLRRIRESQPDLPVILITGAGSEEIAVEAMKLGATDYLVKHGKYLLTVPVVVREALGRRELARQAARYRSALRSTRREVQRLRRELRDRYRLDIPSWRLGLAALARNLPPDEVYEWLQRLKVRRRDAEQVAAAVTVGPRLVERLRDGAEPADVVALAEPYAPDAPLFALALAELEPLHAYFERLRDVQLEVSGADLAELGLEESPRVGEVLAELRRRKLNGELDGRDSELAAARELIAQ